MCHLKSTENVRVGQKSYTNLGKSSLWVLDLFHFCRGNNLNF